MTLQDEHNGRAVNIAFCSPKTYFISIFAVVSWALSMRSLVIFFSFYLYQRYILVVFFCKFMRLARPSHISIKKDLESEIKNCHRADTVSANFAHWIEMTEQRTFNGFLYASFIFLHAVRDMIIVLDVCLIAHRWAAFNFLRYMIFIFSSFFLPNPSWEL